MAKAKQSDVAFLMMKGWHSKFKKMSYEQVGRLMMAVYDYQCNGVDFETDDPTLDMAWSFIKDVFEINMKKYEEMCELNRIKANKRWHKNDAAAYSGINKNAENTDIDIDTDTETDIDTDNDIEIVTEKETAVETDCASSAADDLRLIKSRFDELVNKPYFQTAEMQSPDYRCKSLTLGEMIALHEFVDETALERYFIKVNDYRTDDAVNMILRWAIQDGAVNVQT